MADNYYAAVEALTRELVTIPSVVNTPGEAAIVTWIRDRLAGLPYFRQHPQHLRLAATLKDTRTRYNLLALVKGTPAGKQDTVVLMGHVDTVGIEEFGALRDVACAPEGLARALRNMPLAAQARADLDSGRWMFGRGTVDMKSGVAAQLGVLTRFADHPENLAGNLVLLLTPDEEDMSHGIMAAVSQLNTLAEEEQLRFLGVLNGDYTCARYPGDPAAYVYLGTTGKLLPSFYVVGRETHAGTCFNGLDPNLVTAELTRLIDLNPELCDLSFGEVTVPPVSLKQADRKAVYDVQTPLAAYCYYNFFTNQHDPAAVLDLMVEKGRTAFAGVLEYLTASLARYCALSHLPARKLPWRVRVLTYAEFFQEVAAVRGAEFLAALRRRTAQLLADPTLDLRQFSLAMIETVWQWSPSQEPVVIVYFSSAYSPRVSLDPQLPEVRRFTEALAEAVGEVQTTTEREIAIRHYYPYISDMSIVGDCDLAGVDVLAANMPAWGSKYELDLPLLNSLKLPVANVGPFGADAHQVTERVYTPYSFETLPRLLEAAIRRLLAGS